MDAGGFQFPIANGKKKKVEVHECLDEPWKAKKKNPRSEPESTEQSGKPNRDEIQKELIGTLAEVKEFTNSTLKGKDKKKKDAERLELLGGKAAKNQRMPYNMLMGIRKKAAIREKRKQEELKDSHVVSGKKVSGGKQRKKNKNVDYGLQATPGRLKNGVLRVNKP